MFIQTETTPNPASLKFVPGVDVLGAGVKEFKTLEEAAASPLAEALFGIPGVKGIMYGADFISVTKADDVEWPHLKPAILGLMMEHFVSKAPLFTGENTQVEVDASEEFFDPKDAETVAAIKDILETRIRPAVAQDGGDIAFRGFKDGIVYLNMRGSCAGCPSSTLTLKSGIQNLMKHFLPDVVAVESI